MIAMVLTSAAALPIQAAATDAENQGTAEEKKNKVIEVKEITENSIVFAVSEGRVYAIKVKDEKDSTKDVWKWAVETQYDTEAVSYTHLSAQYPEYRETRGTLREVGRTTSQG